MTPVSLEAFISIESQTIALLLTNDEKCGFIQARFLR